MKSEPKFLFDGSVLAHSQLIVANVRRLYFQLREKPLAMMGLYFQRDGIVSCHVMFLTVVAAADDNEV